MAPVAVLPELEQRGRQQRQRARPALDVGEQRVDELGLDLQAGAPRGQLDRAAQLVAAHRPDEHVAGAEQPRELRVLRAAAVEVGADGDQHERARRIASAATSASANAARSSSSRQAREQLLELVDGDDSRPSASRRPSSAAAGARRAAARAIGQRSLPGSTPAASAASSPARSADDLPLPDGPTMPSQRRAGEPRDQLRDEPLAAEEVAGVVDVERRPGP